MFCYFNEIWNVILVSNVICWTFLVKKILQKTSIIHNRVRNIYPNCCCLAYTPKFFASPLARYSMTPHQNAINVREIETQSVYNVVFALFQWGPRPPYWKQNVTQQCKKITHTKKLHRCNNGIVCNVGCPGLQAAGDLYVNWCQIFVAIWGM